MSYEVCSGAGCNEYREGTLREVNGTVFCYNCSPEYASKRKRGNCSFCNRRDVPVEQHHLFGKENVKDITIPLCCSCHHWLHYHVGQKLPKPTDKEIVLVTGFYLLTQLLKGMINE